jgi:hypothetical protein
MASRVGLVCYDAWLSCKIRDILVKGEERRVKGERFEKKV